MSSDDCVFEIENDATRDIAYAETPEAAVLAYHTLHRDAAVSGDKVTIKNLVTGEMVWLD